MRMFFACVGVLAWIWALAVLWIFSESGGALTVIAAGIYAVVAMVALGCERVLKILEDIRDGRTELTPAASRVMAAPKRNVSHKPDSALV